MSAYALTRPNNPRAVDVNRNPPSAVDTSIELTNSVVAIVKEVGEMLHNVPYVKSLSGVILQIIKIRDEIKANKRRCREIIDKVLRMSNSIYKKLFEVAQSNQREKLSRLEEHLNDHERALIAVYTALEKHRSRSSFVKFVNRGLDELDELDRRLNELNTQLVLDIIFHITMEQVAAVPTIDRPTSFNVPDHVLPPKPYLVVEREEQLDTALNILLSAHSSRIAILGGGGFGKTTLARSILHDPNIAERYQSRYFLSCEGISDVDTLLLGFGTMLGLKPNPSTMLASVRRLLATSETVLCLDNFETPWEPSASRAKIEDVIASIADTPKLSLIITMRGTQRPSKVAWSQPLLAPLPTLALESARVIVKTICPDHTIDEFTENLLQSVEGIPLAITLISNLLRDGETSRTLWTRWSKEQTSIIENGGDDKESNLDASIALSVNSPRMKKNPDTMALLATLSLLPDGFPLAEIDQLQEYLGINTIHKLLQSLRAVALIKPEEAGPFPRVQMLSPIRLFCTQFLSSETSIVLEKVINYYISIMLKADNKQTDTEIYAQVVPEIKNVHSVFQRAYADSSIRDLNVTNLLDATTILTDWSKYIGYLAQDTIQLALDASTNFPDLHAKCLMAQGELYYAEDSNTNSESCFRKAADIFKQRSNSASEATALCRLGDVLRVANQFDQAEVALKESLELCIQTGDTKLQAHADSCFGKLYMDIGRLSEAEECLTSALKIYKQMSDLMGQSNTARGFCRLHRLRGNLVKAEESAIESLNAAKQANHAVGEENALRQLGRIFLLTDRVAEAKQTLEKALTISKQQNYLINQLNTTDILGQVYIQLDHLSAAEALLTESVKANLADVIQIPMFWTTLGWLYLCGDRCDKAEHHLDTALELFQKFESEAGSGQAGVLTYLGEVYLRSNLLDKAEQVLKSIPGLGKWKIIEMRRLWVLGDLYISKGQLEDAETVLNSAMVSAKWRQCSYQQGNILRSLGTLHMKRNHIDQAVEKYKEARECHRKAQWVSEQATDLKRLGEAYEMLGMNEEAKQVFREAEAFMEMVQEARALLEL